MTNGLRHNRDFLNLWAGQTISQLGAQISLLALPLVAAQMLHATSFQMGALRAAEYLPFILFGLFAGVVCDRLGRRAILMTSDFARALLLTSIPVAYLLGRLPIELLFAVAFLVGSASVFFDVAYWSYLPALVERDELFKGNSKLSFSQSMAETFGPGAAGFLVQLLTAPLAIALNAASFLLSAISLLMIRRRAVVAAAPQPDGGAFATVTRGLRHVLQDPILRSLMLRASLWNFLQNMAMPVFLLYSIQTLSLGATSIGFMFSAMGLGAVAGAVLMDTALTGYAVGALICNSVLVAAVVACGIVVRLDQQLAQTAWLAACLFLIGAANAVYNINNVSLRQALTPAGLLGQMTAAMLFVTWGVMPFGALLGGYLGEVIGYPPTLAIVGTVALATAATGLRSGPLKRITNLPAEAAG